MNDLNVQGVREPIVRNLADVDFYKLTMLQFIWSSFRDQVVTFRFKNRTDVDLLESIDLEELRRQLKRVTKMRFPFWCREALRYRYGHIFQTPFLQWLCELRLPMPQVGVDSEGKLLVEVTGPWAQVMLWETITLSIVNRLYFLAKMRELRLREYDILVEGRRRAVAKFQRLSAYPDLPFVDFGTRRRWSYDHQHELIRTAMLMVPNQINGTSNVLLGMTFNLPLVGTMAHELPMALQVVFWDQDEGAGHLVSERKLWQMWEQFYGGQLTVALPDTYGNDFGLADFSPFAASWAGVRHDSGEPFEFGEKVIAFYHLLGIDPTTKMIVFSDGLTDEMMVALWLCFQGRIKVSFGWGTHLMNDMGSDAWPDGNRGLKALSIVMKLVAAKTDGVMRETVKLSDNPSKATGPRDKVMRIIRKTNYNPMHYQAVECEV
ncbi:nicotinate phosphoribosyltransferase [Candidatus Uhrbacteria bacterium]|nr:nicotinate phosphoribosyltransferase [Candidatus Uhrbacteria bacterium]